MGLGKRVKDKGKEIKGKTKKNTGKATGDNRLRVKGKAEELEIGRASCRERV